MDYFRILNLNREPFSNSPDPEFSFRSGQHAICLARLELSIRFRRGLHVVMGEVGTGKTTLCRQLIRRVADDEKLEVHLILDPYFSTPEEFLKTICGMFGLDSDHQSQYSSWQLKEYVKNYIFQKGIDEDKIVVLIIDEGQKLPEFCIEILREFLNFETNEYKLLQTVIFAQKEFKQTIEAYPNFADRISYCHELKGMSFSETIRMIRYRLTLAKAGYETPALFSFFGLLAVYLATRGYPRKIVHLCHRVLLALIIRNESKAGWTLVWWCARMIYPTRRKVSLRRYGPALALSLVLVLAAAVATGPREFSFLSKGMRAAPASEAGSVQTTLDFSKNKAGGVAGTPGSHSTSPATSENSLATQNSELRSASVIRKPVAQVIPREDAPAQADDSKSLNENAPITETAAKEGAEVEPSGPKPDDAKSLPEKAQEKPADSSETTGLLAAADVPHESGESSKSPAAEPPANSVPPDSEGSSFDAAHAASLTEQAQHAPEAVEPLPIEEKDLPQLLGKLSVRRREGLEKMMRKIYGTNDDEYVSIVMQANPEIKDKNLILFGESIRFPAIPIKSAAQKDCWYVQVAEKANLRDAYDFSGKSIAGAPSLRLIPYFEKGKGMRFSVILNQCFDSQESARSAIKDLGSSVSGTAFHPADRQSEAVFFAR